MLFTTSSNIHFDKERVEICSLLLKPVVRSYSKCICQFHTITVFRNISKTSDP